MQTQNHVRWDCTYHVVIVPKYRKKILFGSARREIGKIIRELAKQKGIEIIEGNAGIDHVHLVISIPPKFSIANTMGFLKGKSAILIHLTSALQHRKIFKKRFKITMEFFA